MEGFLIGKIAALLQVGSMGRILAIESTTLFKPCIRKRSPLKPSARYERKMSPKTTSKAVKSILEAP